MPQIFKDGRILLPVVVSAEAHSAVRIAAEDFCSYLGAAAGSGPKVMAEEQYVSGPAVFIGAVRGEAEAALRGMGDEAYAVRVSEEGIFLSGNRPRAVAYAVYDLLNMLGFRFFEPVDYGEVIPVISNLDLNESFRVEAPDKPFREIDLDLSNWDGLEWETRIVRWALKNRINTVGIAPFHEPLRSRLVHCFPGLLREIKRHDMCSCVGGHGMAMFLVLPEKYAGRENFPADEEKFIELMNKNKSERPGFYGPLEKHPRTFKGTSSVPFPCLSNREVVDQMIRTAAEFVKSFPGIDIIRLGSNDAAGPCLCDSCARTAYTPEGFSNFMDLARGLAGAVEKASPGKRFAINLQGGASLVDAPGWNADAKVKDYGLPGSVILWAGLEAESYAGPLTGKAGEGWSMHRALLDRAGRLAEACGCALVVKEMHGSGLYQHVYCPAPRVISKNQEYFRDVLPSWIGTHIFVNPSQHWHQWTLNFLSHYGCLWDASFNVEAMLDDYSGKYFGPAAEIMRDAADVAEKHGTLIALAVNRAHYGYDILEPPHGNWLEIAGKAAGELEATAGKVLAALYSNIRPEYKCRLRPHHSLIEYTLGCARALIPFFEGVRCLARAEFQAGPGEAEGLVRRASELALRAGNEWADAVGKFSVKRYSGRAPGDCPLSPESCWKKIKDSLREPFSEERLRRSWLLE